jgi:hypothetical protein
VWYRSCVDAKGEGVDAEQMCGGVAASHVTGHAEPQRALGVSINPSNGNPFGRTRTATRPAAAAWHAGRY